ncbi:hypothetical protein DL98DRAFT_483692, partial [Cadophora sp. DSE1049]
MLVSSRHMALACTVFKAMLRHEGFKEGHTLSAEGSVQVPLPDDDPRAMQILLDAIQGRNKRVPRKVSLRTLASIAVLADKYQMVEALESFSDLIFRWMEIAWVFGKAEEFKAMTCLVERGGYSDLDNEVVRTFSVPSIIIDTIMKCREDALYECYTLISHTIHRYQNRPEVFCPQTDDKKLRTARDSMLLGSLLKSTSIDRLYSAPKMPYGRISFDDLAPILNGLSVQALC